LPEEAFCANCGASLQPTVPPEPVAKAEAEPALEAPPAAQPEPEIEAAAPPVAAPEAVVPPPPIAEPTAVPACPVCGTEIQAGDKFCSNCGAALEEMPQAMPAEAVPAPAPAVPAGPRLQVVDSGAEIPLPAGEEILIGREDPVSGIYPDIDLTPHGGEEGGVSRRHAKLYVEGSNYFVEDLDSTNYTFINKQKLTPHTRYPVNDGDEIRCGRVALVLNAG
jgi:hypothetical protein